MPTTALSCVENEKLTSLARTYPQHGIGTQATLAVPDEVSDVGGGLVLLHAAVVQPPLVDLCDEADGHLRVQGGSGDAGVRAPELLGDDVFDSSRHVAHDRGGRARCAIRGGVVYEHMEAVRVTLDVVE